VAKTRPGVLLVKNKTLLDTRDLLAHPATKKFIKKIKNPHIVVFKNTAAIEAVCKENGWPLLNPSAELANTIEEKITQVEWLGKLAKYLPPHQILPCKKIKFTGEKFILQFNRAHTGSGTILVESKKQLEEIQKQFPDRPARVTKYIEGPILTSNNVEWDETTFIGNISYQITGLWPFTERPFATIGNDWGLPYDLLNETLHKKYCALVGAIGKKMDASGWKGLFGVDVVFDQKNKKLYLIEINARQPASTTYESQLQMQQKSKAIHTVFEAHLCSLLGLKNTEHKIIDLWTGGQIVFKVTSLFPLLKKRQKTIIKNALNSGCTVIPYTNTEPETDFLRIQSPKPGIFNDLAELEATKEKSRVEKENYLKTGILK
jgi:predicted ATP-grasp superfamily ATP-dependent carboligase